MNLTKIILAVILVASCCISQSDALKCFVCEGKQNCIKPPLLECNQTLANSTSTYLQKYHTGVNATAFSRTYGCIKEYLNFTNGAGSYYKGCIYSNISTCSLGFRMNYEPISRQCQQCSGKDGCNPAGRASSDFFIITTITAAVILFFVWKQI